MKTKNEKHFIKHPAFILNCILAVLGLVGFIISIVTLGSGMVVYYTQLSNIFCMVTAILFLIESVKAQKKLLEANNLRNTAAIGAVELPHWLTIIRFMATSVVIVTFIIVITVLAPSYDNILNGYMHMFFQGANFFYHVACPLLSFVSFAFFEKQERLSFLASFAALIPTICYAAVTIPLNWFYVIDGPYPFLHVHNQSILASVLWCTGILFLAWLIALAIRALHNRGLSKNAPRF